VRDPHGVGLLGSWASRCAVTRAALIPLTLLLLAAPLRAQDLTGLYQVAGELPGGERYVGLAAVSPSGTDRYRVRLDARRAGGQALRLWALGKRTGQELEVRYRPGTGLASIVAGASGGLIVGKYRLAQDGWSGALKATGAADGRARYTKAPLPACSFAAERVDADEGDPAVLVLRGPADALRVVGVHGPGDLYVTGSGATRRVRVTGLPAGEHTFQARLGTDLGPFLATCKVVVAAPAPASVTDEVLAEVERLAADEPLVIFDLDDTLFETRTRSSGIVAEYGRLKNNAVLAAARPEHVRFGLEETLANVGLSAAEIEGALGRDVRRYWSPRFFDGSWFRVDTPLPGSVAYVKRLADAGARIVYLSGRKANTRQQTLDALRAAGFPTGQGTTLFVKPDPAPGEPKLETAEWKGKVTKEQVLPMGKVVAAFDNEPVNCNAFRESLPAATRVIFLDTLYKPDSPPLLDRITTMEGRYE
jgi:phosphoglycolate phosphatase-like HAD superfamily hydrolase